MVDGQCDVNEDRLVRRAREGDQAAFQRLVELFNVMAWQTICVLVRERTAAEDTLQEVWTDVWRGLPGFQPARAFRPWLLAVVANRCRKTTRRPSLPQQPIDALVLERLVAPDEAADWSLRQETRQELQDLLRELSAEQQRVLELRYFADLELAEIAVVMETSVGTVKSRLHRALRHLRKHLCSDRVATEM